MRAVRPGGEIQASACSGQPFGCGARQTGWFMPRQRDDRVQLRRVARRGPRRRSAGPAARSEATTNSNGWRTLAPSGAAARRMLEQRRIDRHQVATGRRYRRPRRGRRDRGRACRTRNGRRASSRCDAPSPDAGRGRRARRRCRSATARAAVAAPSSDLRPRAPPCPARKTGSPRIDGREPGQELGELPRRRPGV